MANSPYTYRPEPVIPAPKCSSSTLHLFDYEETAKEALAICQVCQVKAWCLRQVDPKRNWHTGTVGGVLWRNGYAVPLPDFVPPAELENYLEGLHA